LDSSDCFGLLGLLSGSVTAGAQPDQWYSSAWSVTCFAGEYDWSKSFKKTCFSVSLAILKLVWSCSILTYSDTFHLLAYIYIYLSYSVIFCLFQGTNGSGSNPAEMDHCVLILTEQANTMSRCEHEQTKDWSKTSRRQVEGPCSIWAWHRLGGWFGRRESHSWISLQARAIGLERHPKRQNMDRWLIVYM
jgi:hypothetical protein